MEPQRSNYFGSFYSFGNHHNSFCHLISLYPTHKISRISKTALSRNRCEYGPFFLMFFTIQRMSFEARLHKILFNIDKVYQESYDISC
jgi:hypothetical protein